MGGLTKTEIVITFTSFLKGKNGGRLEAKVGLK